MTLETVSSDPATTPTPDPEPGTVATAADDTRTSPTEGASSPTPGSEAPVVPPGTTEPDMLSLSIEDLERIKSNPETKALYHMLNRAYTTKSQKQAAAVRLLQALETDPDNALQQLASRSGFQLVRPGAATPAPAATPAAPAAPGPESEELRAVLAEALGSIEAADKLTPALQAFLDKRVGHVEAKAEELLTKSAMQESEAIHAAFIKDHPDYAQYETEMADLATKILPGEGVGVTEYLETLYRAAKAGGAKGDAIREVVERQAKVAASVPGRPAGSPQKNTVVKAPEHATFEDAAAAALRGEIWG